MRGKRIGLAPLLVGNPFDEGVRNLIGGPLLLLHLHASPLLSARLVASPGPFGKHLTVRAT